MVSSQIRVVFVSHTSDLYGAERSLLTLVKGLQRGGGVKLTVLVPRDGPLANELRRAQIQVVVHPYAWWIGWDKDLVARIERLGVNGWSVFSGAKLVRQLKPEIIYSNSLATPFGAMMAHYLGVPHVWHAREFVQEDMGARYDWGTRASMRLVGKSARIVCNSKAVKEKMQKYVRENMLRLVYNGFEFKEEKDDLSHISLRYDRNVAGRRPTTLLLIGSVHPGKGGEDAIRALSRLVAKKWNLRLSIVGSGQARYIEDLKQIAHDLGVAESVLWCGFVDNLDRVMTDAAVVLACSRSEAFGRIAVEAQAKGIPVIGTASGGLPEIIEDGVTGLLYGYGNDEQLAAQIERLLGDETLYEKVATQGQQSAYTRFNVGQYVSGVKEILNEVCASYPKGSR